MNKQEKIFDTVAFFRKVKQKLSEKMKGMNLAQKQEFLKNVKEGKIKISLEQKLRKH